MPWWPRECRVPKSHPNSATFLIARAHHRRRMPTGETRSLQDSYRCESRIECPSEEGRRGSEGERHGDHISYTSRIRERHHGRHRRLSHHPETEHDGNSEKVRRSVNPTGNVALVYTYDDRTCRNTCMCSMFVRTNETINRGRFARVDLIPRRVSLSGVATSASVRPGQAVEKGARRGQKRAQYTAYGR